MRTATLSITIGHNEADHLQELLPQLLWVDEVVYVDCDSEDDSLAVAKNHGCRSFSRPNNRNLNVNKSFGIEQTSSDWVFYLDPDERLPEELVQEICEIKDSNTPHVAFRLNRRNHYFGHWLRYGSQYPDSQLRFFRKGKAQFPNRHVHEKLEINGSIGKLHNDMLHHPYLTISQFLRKFDFYTGVEADICWRRGFVRNGATICGFWCYDLGRVFGAATCSRVGFETGFQGCSALSSMPSTSSSATANSGSGANNRLEPLIRPQAKRWLASRRSGATSRCSPLVRRRQWCRLRWCVFAGF